MLPTDIIVASERDLFKFQRIPALDDPVDQAVDSLMVCLGRSACGCGIMCVSRILKNTGDILRAENSKIAQAY